MIGVFVTFISVVYRRMIYRSVPKNSTFMSEHTTFGDHE